MFNVYVVDEKPPTSLPATTPLNVTIAMMYFAAVGEPMPTLLVSGMVMLLPANEPWPTSAPIEIAM
jgi:hypothetical protein